MGATMKPRIILDTNVLVAGLRSRRGASFQLLAQLTRGRFQVVVTVPLVMEYADVLSRPGMVPLPTAAVEAVLDMICHEAVQQAVHFLWRPQLRDPKDEMVLEAAVNARADYLVTHNIADFSRCHFDGLHIVTPRQFIEILEGDES